MDDLPEIIPIRVVIHTRDVQNITGLSERGARYLMQRIRIAYKKSRYEYITIMEFCAYTKIAEEVVRRFLRL
jgi:hypothetical protein